MFESSRKLLRQKLSLFFTLLFQKETIFNLQSMSNIMYCLLTETKMEVKEEEEKAGTS